MRGSSTAQTPEGVGFAAAASALDEEPLKRLRGVVRLSIKSIPLCKAYPVPSTAAALHSKAVSSSTERPACRRIERSVQGASSRWSGTMTVRPSACRSLTWLPRWPTWPKPILFSA
jgi:hypothetical protein